MGLGENVKYAVKRYPTLFLQKTKARCGTPRRRRGQLRSTLALVRCAASARR